MPPIDDLMMAHRAEPGDGFGDSAEEPTVEEVPAEMVFPVVRSVIRETRRLAEQVGKLERAVEAQTKMSARLLAAVERLTEKVGD